MTFSDDWGDDRGDSFYNDKKEGPKDGTAAQHQQKFDILKDAYTER